MSDAKNEQLIDQAGQVRAGEEVDVAQVTDEIQKTSAWSVNVKKLNDERARLKDEFEGLVQIRYLTPVEKTKSGGKLRKEVVALADELSAAIEALDAAREVSKSDTHAQAKHSCDKVLPAMLKVRAAADALEEIVADEYWPLPSYQELLFLR